MNLPRRRFVHLAAGVAALPAVSHLAWSQTYPARPVRLIVGAAPGGGTDVVARLIGPRLQDRLGQPFVVENRPSAGGNVATEAVVRSPPDGHTLLVGGVNNAVNAALFDRLNFDFVRDIAPVAGIVRVPNIIMVHPSVPAKTVPEFIAYAKANPVNMASGGNGSSNHMAGELFKMMAGVNMLHVPYRGGGPALADLLGGQVQVLFATAPGMADYVRTGKLRALAVTTTMRLKELPDVPTVGEFVPGYESSQWYGVGAPRNTPAEIIDKLNMEINAALADAKLRARLSDLGGTPLPGSPADFGKLIAEETEKWARVVRFAGLKAE
jgi:tripartite-type tricarboxylate transporter receptor subunit TctC